MGLVWLLHLVLYMVFSVSKRSLLKITLTVSNISSMEG